MKKLLMSSVIAISSLTAFTACANVGAATDTRAYHNMPHGNPGQMHMQSPLSQLDLTANQRAQIQAIRQNNRGNRTQNHAAIMQILTPEQQKQLSEIQSQYMNNDNRMRRGEHHMNYHMNRDGHHMNRGRHMNKDGHMNRGRPINNQ